MIIQCNWIHLSGLCQNILFTEKKLFGQNIIRLKSCEILTKWFCFLWYSDHSYFIKVKYLNFKSLGVSVGVSLLSLDCQKLHLTVIATRIN